jgi:hypothetical protein
LSVSYREKICANPLYQWPRITQSGNFGVLASAQIDDILKDALLLVFEAVDES